LESCPVFMVHFYYLSTNRKKYSLKLLPYAEKSGIIEVLMHSFYLKQNRVKMITGSFCRQSYYGGEKNGYQTR